MYGPKPGCVWALHVGVPLSSEREVERFKRWKTCRIGSALGRGKARGVGDSLLAWGVGRPADPRHFQLMYSVHITSTSSATGNVWANQPCHQITKETLDGCFGTKFGVKKDCIPHCNYKIKFDGCIVRTGIGLLSSNCERRAHIQLLWELVLNAVSL